MKTKYPLHLGVNYTLVKMNFNQWLNEFLDIRISQIKSILLTIEDNTDNYERYIDWLGDLQLIKEKNNIMKQLTEKEFTTLLGSFLVDNIHSDDSTRDLSENAAESFEKAMKAAILTGGFKIRNLFSVKVVTVPTRIKRLPSGVIVEIPEHQTVKIVKSPKLDELLSK